MVICYTLSLNFFPCLTGYCLFDIFMQEFVDVIKRTDVSEGETIDLAI